MNIYIVELVPIFTLRFILRVCEKLTLPRANGGSLGRVRSYPNYKVLTRRARLFFSYLRLGRQ